MKIGILFSHQHEALRTALAALLPAHDIISLPLELAGGANAPLAAEALAVCDHVITEPVSALFGPLATAALRTTVPRLHVLPAFHFAGFHPDTVTVSLDGENLRGPTGDLHSRLAVAGFLGGLSARETADLFNRLSFERLGYFDRFAAERAALLAHYRAYRIDLTTAFDAWLTQGAFMHAPNQPRIHVMLGLATLACAIAGLTAAPIDPNDPPLPDVLASAAMHPVFPDIASACGVAAAGAYRGPVTAGARPRVLSTESFVAACFAAFRTMPLTALRHVDGVARAMAALGLPERPRPVPLPPPATDTTTAFLTWCGFVLGVEAASGLVVHRKLDVHHDGSTDLLVSLPSLKLDQPATVQIGGPVTLKSAIPYGAQSNADGAADEEPVPTDNPRITLTRNAKLLWAEPGRVAALFNQEQPSDFTLFLPVRAARLADLRRLATNAWRVSQPPANDPAPDTVLTPAMISLLPGWRLALGDTEINLLATWPEPVSGEDGASGFCLQRGDQKILLLEAPDAAVPPEQLLAPLHPSQIAADAATEEEFALASQSRLILAGPPEYLHMPLTACDADIAWAGQKYLDKTAPPHGPGWQFHLPGIGRHQFDTTVFRGQDMLLLLERDVEGVLLDDRGAAKDYAFLPLARRAPRAVRRAGTCHMLDLAQARDAAKIDGPVCVFYNPSLQNYYHWIAEALLSLHIMEPYLPADIRLVLPGTLADFRRTGSTQFDHLQFLAALGFGHHPIIEMAVPAVRVDQAIWLASDAMCGMPAPLLRSFRSRVTTFRPQRNGTKRRLLVQRTKSRAIANLGRLEGILQPHGFETVTLENLPAGEQIDLFLQAEFVIAAHGAGMVNTIFCAPGTRVMELSPMLEYRPYFWQIADKLGLVYSVLPCPTLGRGDFSDNLMVDEIKFRALFRMLRAVVD